MKKKIIGVLSLQGAFIEHKRIINELNHIMIEVRKENDINLIDALIIPGGESTTMIKLLDDNLLLKNKIIEFIFHKKKPVLGICAGIILLADKVIVKDKIYPGYLGGLDITIHRNYYGSQINSFIEKNYDFHEFGIHNFKCIFIRAPYITNNENKFAIKYNNIMGLIFHPELTDDNRFHKYFINMIE